MTRRAPSKTFTMTQEVELALVELATQDAEAQGRNPERQQSATLATLILTEQRRRRKLAQKKIDA